jgi:hypothetical protein
LTPLGLRVTNILVVTLSFIEFQMFLLFLEILQFGSYVPQIE